MRMGLASSKPGPKGRNSSGQIAPNSYAQDAANAIGVSIDKVKRDLRRGSKIAPEVLADISGTDLDKGVVLDRFAPN